MGYREFSDAALLRRLRELAATERRATADFLACLAEADRRPRAVAAEGYTSLFDFCVRDLKLAESTAYQRVKAAREANRRPEIFSMLADGTINLSNLCLIAPLLERKPELLESIEGRSKRDVEALVASMGEPRAIPDRIRPLPPRPAQPADAERLPLSGPPEAPAAVERLKALLWHKYPAGRLEDVLLEAVSDFIARRDPARDARLIAAVAPADPRARRITAALRRAVWRRDESRCTFVGPAGRCPETRGLEIDHIVPWALGGRSDDPANLRLLCRAHNQAEAQRVFGTESTRADSGG